MMVMIVAVAVAVTGTGPGWIERLQTAVPRFLQDLLQVVPPTDVDGYACCGETRQCVPTHTPHRHRVQAGNVELLDRTAPSVLVVFVPVAQHLHITRLGIQDTEVGSAAEVSEHRGIDPLIRSRGNADAHLPHPS